MEPDLNALVDRALAKGKLTQAEMDTIAAVINADGKISRDEVKIVNYPTLIARR